MDLGRYTSIDIRSFAIPSTVPGLKPSLAYYIHRRKSHIQAFSHLLCAVYYAVVYLDFN